MRCATAIVALIGVGCGGNDGETADAGPPDAWVRPDAAFDPICSDGDPVTITGTTPRGPVDGLDYLNVWTSYGFCNLVHLELTAQPAYGHPEPRPLLSIEIALDRFFEPISGDFAATVRFVDDTGEVETTGTFSAETIEPLWIGDEDKVIRGRLVVDDAEAGWSLDLAIDATYCEDINCV